MNDRVIGSVLVSVGVLLILASASLLVHYDQQAHIAGKNAELLLEGLTEEIERQEEQQVYQPEAEEVPSGEMSQTVWNGYAMVGVIRAPEIDLELPVLDDWSYDLLQLVPCRYSGSVKEENLILLGHNYKKHFAPLKKLTAGDIVKFCDVSGTVYQYQVALTEVLEKTELDRLTAFSYDLTLFTCTNSGYSRFVVRCDLTAVSLKSGAHTREIL